MFNRTWVEVEVTQQIRNSLGVVVNQPRKTTQPTLSSSQTARARVACTVQWESPNETPGDVIPSPGATIYVLARDWPYPAQTRFRWGGNWFEQVGPAMERYGSRRTRHFEVRARWIGQDESRPGMRF